MPSAETARLIASLELQDKFTPNANKALGTIGKLDAGFDSVHTRALKAGQQIGTGIKNGALIAAGGIGILASQVAIGLKSLAELETVTTQTNAVLKSTNGVAGETAGSIRDLAEKYEGLNATIDDKVIQSAENVLLTFTAIRKDAFEPAIAAALDMSTALGTDLQGSVIQIGKALQDPIKGITALRRVGVNFSADQITVIKRLVETGHTLDAQKLILKELNTEFGGSFLAGGSTTAGKVAKFRDSIEDLQKTLATALLPVIGKVADGLSTFLADPAVVKGAKDLGDSLAGLFSDENLKQGADFLKGAFQTAKEAAPIVASAAKATFALVQGAVGLFKSLPPQLQTLLVSGFAINKLTGGLVTNLAGGLISSVLKQLVSGVVNVNGGVVNVTGAGGIAGAAGAGGGGLVSTALKVVLPVAAAAAIFEIGKSAFVDGITAANKQQETGLASQTASFTGGASLADLKSALAGIDGQIADFNSGITPQGTAFALNIDGVKDSVIATRSALVSKIADLESTSQSTISAIKDADSGSQAAIRRAANIARDKLEQVKDAASNVGRVVKSASAGQIAANIRGAQGIESAQNRSTAASRATTEAVKDKDLSVHLTVPITNRTTVTLRDMVLHSQSGSRLGRVIAE